MDLKGQKLAEKSFLGIMWTITFISAFVTFIVDDVKMMFFIFSGGLACSALVRAIFSFSSQCYYHCSKV